MVKVKNIEAKKQVEGFQRAFYENSTQFLDYLIMFLSCIEDCMCWYCSKFSLVLALF